MEYKTVYAPINKAPAPYKEKAQKLLYKNMIRPDGTAIDIALISIPCICAYCGAALGNIRVLHPTTMCSSIEHPCGCGNNWERIWRQYFEHNRS